MLGWGRKSYLGPAEIVSFSNWSFSHLNRIRFKCETPLLVFLLIIYYTSFDQQLSLMFFKIGVPKILLISQESICVGVFF